VKNCRPPRQTDDCRSDAPARTRFDAGHQERTLEPAHNVPPPLPALLDAGLEDRLTTLSANKLRWANLPTAQKIQHLHRIETATIEHAAEWVAVSVRAKGTAGTPPLAGEEWMSGPWALLRAAKQLSRTLASARDDFKPLQQSLPVRSTVSGQLAVQVFPGKRWERLLMNGIRAEVWLEPGAELEIGSAYRSTPCNDGRLDLVLGAGNVSSIAPLDALYKLYNESAVVLLKLNPVNDYLRPILEKVFASLIEDGFAAIAAGDAHVGSTLCKHPLVEAIHITGSAATHDAIVFGSENGAHLNRINHKPITSELGGVGPVIVVPGPWTEADLNFQALHIATQRLHNGGFNCVAAQVAVLPAKWPQTPALIAAIRHAVNGAPDRPAYYPGARQRIDKFRGHYDTHRNAGEHADRVIVLIPADFDGVPALLFSEEAFAPVLAITQIPGDDASAFLDIAVDFCNQRLSGTLGASILIHPDTVRELGDRFEQTLANLRYGCIGVNIWQGAGFLLTETPWGAYPGNTIDKVDSGIGNVHNTLMLNRPQKSIVFGPFHPFPRGLLHGCGLLPLPPWFVSHRSAHRVGRLLFEFEAKPSLLKLPAIAWNAMRS
jgi:aldehyde dehydrogenase (NAD(P)+)